MKLRRNQLCPLHRSFACCGREPIPKERRACQMGVRRVDDPQHPRGYREIRSNTEMRKLMDRKIAAQTACALSARGSSRITATSFRTTSIPVEWEERGGTTIPTTFRLFTGGATGKRDRAEGEPCFLRIFQRNHGLCFYSNRNRDGGFDSLLYFGVKLDLAIGGSDGYNY